MSLISAGSILLDSTFKYNDQRRQKYTNRKENQIFLIYKEILGGEVAKSYMTNGLLIYGGKFVHFLIY